jgi:hypothetical protein
MIPAPLTLLNQRLTVVSVCRYVRVQLLANFRPAFLFVAKNCTADNLLKGHAADCHDLSVIVDRYPPA